MQLKRTPKTTIGSTVISGQAKQERLEVEFLDGKRWVEPYLVGWYGGKEKFDLTANVLKEITYTEFSQGIWAAVQRQNLNKIQAKMISGFRFAPRG